MSQRRCFWCDYVVDTEEDRECFNAEEFNRVECEACREWTKQMGAYRPDPAERQGFEEDEYLP